MKYIRTKDGRIVDLTDKDYIMNGNDLILHEQYDTVGGLRCKKDSMIQASIAVITKHNEYKFVGTIEKQADTIEELCDEICETFELVDKNKFDAFMKNEPTFIAKHFEKPVVQKYEILKEYPREHLIKLFYEKDNELGIKTTIYGAIWISKGLIYVAKMNEKGEMELL